jgi:hypothetical protein
MDERTIFVDEFQDAASKDGDWLIISKSNFNYVSPSNEGRHIVLV